MATFASGFIRPGVYVKQTAGPGAAQLPSSFISALIGQGSDRFTIFSKQIVSTGPATDDILDSDRNVAAITGVRLNNIDQLSYCSILHTSNQGIPFNTVAPKIHWSANKPAAGVSYYVTYIAYKNPLAHDYDVALVSDLNTHLNYYGAAVQASHEIVNGNNLLNAISMGADIEKNNGATSWYAAQLNPFNETTLSTAAAVATVTGAVGTTGATGTVFTVNLNGDGAQSVSVAAGITGANLAEYLLQAVHALTATNPALQAAYDYFDVDYIGGSNTFIVYSGMAGSNSSVVVTGTALTGGTPAVGTGPTMFDLTDEAGLLTALQQVLAKLELLDAWVIIPCFPAIIGGINASLVPVIDAHVAAMRDIATQKWRVALLGAQQGTDTGTNPETKYINTATAMGSNALGVVAPSTAVYTYNGLDFTLDGWSIAAAVAGVMTNPVYGAGEPIAGKNLVGFSSIKDVFNTTQKNTMGTAGVLMIDNEIGVPAIIQDLTTDQSNAVNSQFKFTRAADYVAKSLRLILRKLYINTNNLGDATMSNIGSSIKMILQQMVWLHIINDFSDPQVAKNGSDPRQVDVVVSIQLVPDVTWIYVNLGVNL